MEKTKKIETVERQIYLTGHDHEIIEYSLLMWQVRHPGMGAKLAQEVLRRLSTASHPGCTFLTDAMISCIQDAIGASKVSALPELWKEFDETAHAVKEEVKKDIRRPA